MIKSLLVIIAPLVFLIDCALFVTWVTMLSVDGIGRPTRFSLRSLLIAMTVIAIHFGLIAAITFSF
jgi:hypothetical protein